MTTDRAQEVTMDPTKHPREIAPVSKTVTGVNRGHNHPWNPGDRFTGRPSNDPTGHIHQVDPGATVTAEEEGHTHKL